MCQLDTYDSVKGGGDSGTVHIKQLWNNLPMNITGHYCYHLGNMLG